MLRSFQERKVDMLKCRVFKVGVLTSWAREGGGVGGLVHEERASQFCTFGIALVSGQCRDLTIF